MVEAAVCNRRPEADVKRLCLALPRSILNGFGPRVSTWVNHAWLWQAGRWIGRSNPDSLYHVLDGSYAYVAQRVPASRLLVTCHDLIPYLQCRGILEGRPGRMAATVIEASLEVIRRAASLTAVSGSTRKDLVAWAGIESERVHVIHPVLDPFFAKGLARDPVPAGRREARVLHMGSNAGYKNRMGVLDVFEKLVAGRTATLVLAGPMPTSAMMRRLNSPVLAGRVTLCVDPSDQDLRRLYGESRVLLFPSVYEGFGSPVLEAMASGCPVVCSAAASLPEVTGGAALMAEPMDADRLTAHCRDVLSDAALADSLALRGLRRAADFSAGAMGDAFWQAYDGLSGGTARGPDDRRTR
jgi:glycosyltransferase involved in cell wall biosynthesis